MSWMSAKVETSLSPGRGSGKYSGGTSLSSNTAMVHLPGSVMNILKELEAVMFVLAYLECIFEASA